MTEWIRVRRSSPCQICGSGDWCSVNPDSKHPVVRCMRVESQHVSEGSDGSIGWIHTLDGPIPKREPRVVPPPTADFRELALKFFNQGAEAREELAVLWNVSLESVISLGIGRGRDEYGKQFYSIPIKNADGGVVGIIKRYPNGKKLCVPGSSNSGAFYPKEWDRFDGPIFIPEGASDVAAFISVGLNAIGRTSNVSGITTIVEMLGRKCHKTDKKVIVVGENDEKDWKRGEKISSCTKRCKGCAYCWPGRHGAIVTADELRADYIFPPKGYKDFREYRPYCWPESLRMLG